jgi:predicted subunit of tRNA(5-methylaminomethyl-2-thiouridylate) methyltransferase
MAQINKQQLKDYFRRGNKPTESQFEDLIDSNINVVSSKITIDNDLNIGLDVDNPQAKLHVNGSLQLEQKTDYTGAKGTVRWTGSDLVVKTENEDTSDSWKSLVDTSGTVSIDEYNNRIGIGLTEQSPLSRLHLNGPVRIDNPTEHINKAMLNVLGSVGIGTDQPKSNLHIAATYNQALTGTVSGIEGETELTGIATLFNSELHVGQKIQIDTHSYTINSITSDTNLTLNEALVENATDATVYIAGDLLKVQDIVSAPVLTIDKEGNVGIGTDSPKIHLAIGDSDTGLQQHGDGELAIYTNNIERLRVNKSGNVGIGTTSPSAKLEINAGNNETPLIIMGNGGTQAVGITQNQVGGSSTMELTTTDSDKEQATRLLFRGGNNNADIEFYRGARESEQVSMIINGTNGNVGIGTDRPSAKLEVAGTTKLNGDVDIATSGSLFFGREVRQMINLWSNSYGIGIQSYTQYYRTNKNFAWYKGGSHNDGELNAGAGGTVQMVIKDGNVGIGTRSPSAKLEVNGNVKATSFEGNGASLTNLNANKITEGTLTADRIPNLDASKITTGTLATDRIPNLNANKITEGTLTADRIPNLDANKITTGTLTADRIPNLNANKITEGTLTADRIPNLDASKITTGTLATDRIPNLNANKITEGTLTADRIPNLNANKITTGTLTADRIPNLNANKITGEITLAQLSQEIQNLLIPHYIGQERYGGIVFKINSDLVSGLVCAIEDQPTGNWATCKYFCENYNGWGHSDWRMPTKEELNDMRVNLHQGDIGGFAPAWYWSSTEVNDSTVWIQSFGSGLPLQSGKASSARVRAVRAF